MPLYEYSCPKCGKTIEVIQKFSDPPLANCPDCQGPVEKLVSRTSFQLKGTGWYQTDYKKSTNTSAKVESKAAETPKETTPKKSGEGT